MFSRFSNSLWKSNEYFCVTFIVASKTIWINTPKLSNMNIIILVGILWTILIYSGFILLCSFWYMINYYPHDFLLFYWAPLKETLVNYKYRNKCSVTCYVGKLGRTMNIPVWIVSFQEFLYVAVFLNLTWLKFTFS